MSVMSDLTVKQDPRVHSKFAAYPKNVRKRMDHLRELILETASEIPGIDKLEETLKWHEPSYVVKKGSTIRIDWKQRSPDRYALYFNCNSRLVETFRMVYGDIFDYEKNRAILFHLDDPIPEEELKACITMALTYHSVKNEPFLGK